MLCFGIVPTFLVDLALGIQLLSAVQLSLPSLLALTLTGSNVVDT